MSPMRKLTSALAGLALLPASAQALPLMDIEVEGYFWQADPSGEIEYNGDKSDLADDLGFSKEWRNPSLYARVALPLVTIDVEQTRLGYSGDVEKEFSWKGETATVGGDSSLDLSITHAGAMFNPVPLPFVDLGFGIGASRISTDAEVTTAAGTESTSDSFTLPVAKLEARVSPPVLDLQFILRGNGLAYGSNGYTDILGEVAFATGALQFRAGYRQVQFKVDTSSVDIYADTTFSGPFAGLAVAF